MNKESMLPITIAAVLLPLSLFLWIGHLLFTYILGGYSEDNGVDGGIIPPTRWLAATVIPLTVVIGGLRKKSLNSSGALLGLLMGFVLTLSNYAFMACLLAFFVSSSKATRFRNNRKRKLEEDFKEGGQRNWVQVLCNGAMATQLALFYMLDVGYEERPINFTTDYRASWLGIGVLGTIACCNGDTWASELGTVVGSSEPVLITNWKRVPRGTNGGITLVGTLCSILGGLIVGISYYVTIYLTVDVTVLAENPPQWPLIAVGAIGGFLGSAIDSLLGAKLQFSGLDMKTKQIVEHSGADVKPISGAGVLDNHSVNLVSSILVGILLPRIAIMVWP